MPDKQNVFYHYTSVDALYNIVSNRTFWLANAKSSNDKTEGNFSIEEFCDILSDVKHNIASPSICNAIDLFKENCKELHKSRSFYILSMTTMKDNLTHWERYACGKNGVAIALSENLFKTLDNKIFSLFRKDVIFDFNVIYAKEKCINTIIEHLTETFDMFKTHQNADIILRSTLSRMFYRISYCIKNNSFKDENECRILLDSDEMKNRLYALQKGIPLGEKYATEIIKKQYFNLLSCLSLEQTYFAPIRGEIRSLHHLNLSEIWDSDLIPEIMLGPNCPQSVEELRAFLDANGLQNTKITESKIPLR